MRWLLEPQQWFTRPVNRIVQRFHCAAGWHAWQFHDGDERRHCRACGHVYPPA